MYLGGEVCEGAHLRAEHGVGFVEAAVGRLVGLSAGLRRVREGGRRHGQAGGSATTAAEVRAASHGVQGQCEGETHLQGDAEVY